MGQLIDGIWHDNWYDTKSTGGAFKRSTSPSNFFSLQVRCPS